MNAKRTRRGSAILVVLGMATFMIVSALSFSVYMRQSRQPSSYLHKNATTHHLAKAAVQRAMGELDAYLRADQSFYPGLPSRTPAYHADTLTYHTGDDKCSWIGRVFCPPYESDGQSSSEGRLASPLTLEGLGYVPPPFVNELRFYAPKSEAARWKRFAFDAGRYSYAVLNVSDCFDVNTLSAYTNRNSGSIGRVSLAPLFEDLADHSTFDAGEANLKNFEQFLRTRGGESADIPFISLLDFNLSLRRAGLPAVKSPFCEYVKNGGTFYGSVIGGAGRSGSGGSGFEQASNRVARMMFTTDSLPAEWDPARNPRAFKVPDLATAKTKGPIALGRVSDQPWTKYESAPFFLYLPEKAFPGRFVTELMNTRFSAVDVATLRDYLDADDVPTSLALPCTERVPSVVCIRPVMPMLQYRIERKKGNTKKVSDTKKVRSDVYNLLIDNDDGGYIRCVGVYPFKWGEAFGKIDKRKFYAQALVRIFFAPKDLGTRQDYDPESFFATYDATQWGASERIETPNADGKSGSVLTLRTKEVDITKKVPLKTVMRETDDALFEFELDVPKLPEDRYSWPLCTITREIDPDTDEPIAGRPEDYEAGICPFDRDGNALLSAAVTAAGTRDSDEYVPFVSVSVRISMEAGDGDVVRNQCPGGLVPTVDLVPATMTDDALNGLDEQECSDVGLTYGQSLLFFRAAQVRADVGADPDTVGRTLGFRYGRAFLEDNCDTVTAAAQRPGGLARVGVNFEWGALWTADPRYNYAPENWWADSRMTIDEELTDYWADQMEAMLDESAGADSDIFMAVSNQEYLQSVGELGFLPRIQDIWGNTSPGNLTGAFFDDMNKMMLNPDYAPFDASGGGGRLSRNKLADAGRMWRTYRLYSHDENTGSEGAPAGRDTAIYDEFDVRPDVVTPAFAVNPFTESELPLLTVFSETPWSWEYASTNEWYSPIARLNGGRFPNFLKRIKYTWSESSLNKDSGGGFFVHDDTLKILRSIQSKFRSSPDADWTKIWNKLDWFDEDNPKDFLDIVLDNYSSPLHAVDRKFLYSYWRECFGNRQQLFLIFVRAEPLSPGGSSRTAAASPQMGAKAVALVWRDPRDPEDGNGNTYGNSRPHAMRVLFYHQFE